MNPLNSRSSCLLFLGLLTAIWILAFLQNNNTTVATDRHTSHEECDHERVVFLLQYIGRDYQNAVAEGAVINEFEYREIITFCQQVIEMYSVFEQSRNRDLALLQLQDLRQMVYQRAERYAIQDLTTALVRDLAKELHVESSPETTPNIEKGKFLYEAGGCGVCHGASGAGDGYAANGLVPEPTSFQGRIEMNEATPFRFFNAIKLGVSGTAMPSHEEAFSRQEIWEVAFYLMTLRDGFDPHLTVGIPGITLEELATKSDLELMWEIKDRREFVQPTSETQDTAISASLDFLRRYPEILK